MKKILCIILCVAITSTCFAYSQPTSVENNFSGSSNAVEVLLTESDSALVANAALQTQNIEFESVDYSYQFELANEAEADVELEFTLCDGEGNIYPAFANGRVYLNSFSSVDMWLGPLEGYITIEGVDYSILASFAKPTDSSNIQVGITFQSAGSINYATATIENIFHLKAVSFGENVLDNQAVEEIMNVYSESVASSSLTNTENAESTSTNDEVVENFALSDITLAGFGSSESIPGYGQRGRLYFD